MGSAAIILAHAGAKCQPSTWGATPERGDAECNWLARGPAGGAIGGNRSLSDRRPQLLQNESASANSEEQADALCDCTHSMRKPWAGAASHPAGTAVNASSSTTALNEEKRRPPARESKRAPCQRRPPTSSADCGQSEPASGRRRDQRTPHKKLNAPERKDDPMADSQRTSEVSPITAGPARSRARGVRARSCRRDFRGGAPHSGAPPPEADTSQDRDRACDAYRGRVCSGGRS
jgi:hypothetical protein